MLINTRVKKKKYLCKCFTRQEMKHLQLFLKPLKPKCLWVLEILRVYGHGVQVNETVPLLGNMNVVFCFAVFCRCTVWRDCGAKNVAHGREEPEG